jgi:hypothetical protein
LRRWQRIEELHLFLHRYRDLGCRRGERTDQRKAHDSCRPQAQEGYVVHCFTRGNRPADAQLAFDRRNNRPGIDTGPQRKSGHDIGAGEERQGGRNDGGLASYVSELERLSALSPSGSCGANEPGNHETAAIMIRGERSN